MLGPWSLVAVAIALTGLTLAGPLLLVDRWLHERSWEHRALGLVVAALGQTIAVFEALTSARAFTLAGVMTTELTICLLAAWAARPGLAARLERDADALVDSLARTRLVARVGLAIAAGFVALVTVRGLLLPPLGWDALTYHLTHAARWVQTGARPIEIGPGAWGYYAYFPYVGDVPWAWAMLPFHGDTWVSLPAAACLPAIAVATFALARELGAEHDGAWLAAALTVLCPAVVGYAELAYVDNLLLFLWAAGSVFLGRYWRGGARADLVLCLLALGLAAGAKPSGLPVLAAGGALVGARALWRRQAGSLAVGLAMAALCCRTYATAWLDRGSPLWPMAMPVLPGDPEIVALLTTHDTVELGVGAVLALLFLLREPVSHYFLNLGPVAAITMLLAVPEAVRALADPRVSRVLVAWLLGSTGVIASLVFATQPTDWIFAIGRLLTPMALTAAAFSARRLGSPWLGYALVLLAVPYAWPRGVRPTEAPALAVASVALAAVGAVLVVACRRRSAIAAALGGAAGFMLLVALAGRHASERYRHYEAARAPVPLYTAHPIDRELVLPDLWARLDDGAPHRVGYAAGWDGVGHNWLLYPVLGTHLQNTVHWVSPVEGAAIPSYRLGDDLDARMDRAAWLARIRDLDLDWFLAAAPAPPEARWLEPPCFREEARNADAALFRVDRACVRAAAEALEP
jgi:hypothetical protein